MKLKIEKKKGKGESNELHTASLFSQVTSIKQGSNPQSHYNYLHICLLL